MPAKPAYRSELRPELGSVPSGKDPQILHIILGCLPGGSSSPEAHISRRQRKQERDKG